MHYELWPLKSLKLGFTLSTFMSFHSVFIKPCEYVGDTLLRPSSITSQIPRHSWIMAIELSKIMVSAL